MIAPTQLQLATQYIGRRTLFFENTDSTNGQLWSHAGDRANHGLALLAGAQSAGRGQHGRHWHSPAGSSVLLSVLLFPPPRLRRPALLTAWAAVSVCELVRESIGLQAKIKWPNDVLVQGKKVCGILIEQRASGPGHSATVAGIGLNVTQDARWFADAGLPDAASLAVFSNKRLDPLSLARELLHILDEEYCRMDAEDLVSLEACWKWRLGLLGKNVVVESVKGIHRGRVREISFDGVELETPGSGALILPPESIRHIRP
jgi:BirA family biotin operon repressor/biotin-[acetyl-CoA-carboxylase] ligase